MGRYRFLSAKSLATPSIEDVAKAEIVDDWGAALDANKSQGEFEFKDDNTAMVAAFGKIKSAEIVTEMLENGNPVNRIVAVTENKGKQRFRCYGKGRENILPAHTLTAAEIKKIVFGFCISDNEVVRETRVDGATGKVIKTRVPYANVEAL